MLLHVRALLCPLMKHGRQSSVPQKELSRWPQWPSADDLLWVTAPGTFRATPPLLPIRFRQHFEGFHFLIFLAVATGNEGELSSKGRRLRRDVPFQHTIKGTNQKRHLLVKPLHDKDGAA